MQPVSQLGQILEEVSSDEHFIYSKSDLRNMIPSITDYNLNMILSRCISKKILIRVCKGIYFFCRKETNKSIVLYKTAAKLRCEYMNYISLETVLCEHSIISQQMPSFLTVMTSGRSGLIDCGQFGTIEFVHTAKDFSRISANLFIDTKAKMLKATPVQAYRDMVDTRRTTLALIDESAKKELI